LTILLQERIDEDSPPILKWADPIQQWNMLRPLINWVEKRTMPPCPKEEENVWFYLFNAAMGMNKTKIFSPENLLGVRNINFSRGSNRADVQRQIKALNLALCLEEWCVLRVQNSLEIQDWDLQCTAFFQKGQ
jgi:hypothetical protein